MPLAGLAPSLYPAVQIDELTLEGALRGVSLHVPRGGLCCVLGPGGGGKTALLRVLAGHARPQSGRALVLGQDPCRDRAALRARVGYLPPERVLDPTVPLGRQAARSASLCGLSVRHSEARYRALLTRLGLRAVLETPAAALASGQRRLGEVALALLLGAELLLLDDPDVGMDPEQRQRLFDLLGQLRITALFTARDPAQAERAARVAVLARGRLLAAGTPQELKLRHAGGWPVLLRLAPGVSVVSQPPATPAAAESAQQRLLRLLQDAGYRVLSSLEDPTVLGVVLPAGATGPDPAALTALNGVIQDDSARLVAPPQPHLPDLAAVLQGLLISAD